MLIGEVILTHPYTYFCDSTGGQQIFQENKEGPCCSCLFTEEETKDQLGFDYCKKCNVNLIHNYVKKSKVEMIDLVSNGETYCGALSTEDKGYSEFGVPTEYLEMIKSEYSRWETFKIPKMTDQSVINNYKTTCSLQKIPTREYINMMYLSGATIQQCLTDVVQMISNEPREFFDDLEEENQLFTRISEIVMNNNTFIEHIKISEKADFFGSIGPSDHYVNLEIGVQTEEKRILNEKIESVRRFFSVEKDVDPSPDHLAKCLKDFEVYTYNQTKIDCEHPVPKWKLITSKNQISPNIKYVEDVKDMDPKQLLPKVLLYVESPGFHPLLLVSSQKTQAVDALGMFLNMPAKEDPCPIHLDTFLAKVSGEIICDTKKIDVDYRVVLPMEFYGVRFYIALTGFGENIRNFPTWPDELGEIDRSYKKFFANCTIDKKGYVRPLRSIQSGEEITVDLVERGMLQGRGIPVWDLSGAPNNLIYEIFIDRDEDSEVPSLLSRIASKRVLIIDDTTYEIIIKQESAKLVWYKSDFVFGSSGKTLDVNRAMRFYNEISITDLNIVEKGVLHDVETGVVYSIVLTKDSPYDQIENLTNFQNQLLNESVLPENTDDYEDTVKEIISGHKRSKHIMSKNYNEKLCELLSQIRTILMASLEKNSNQNIEEKFDSKDFTSFNKNESEEDDIDENFFIEKIESTIKSISEIINSISKSDPKIKQEMLWHWIEVQIDIFTTTKREMTNTMPKIIDTIKKNGILQALNQAFNTSIEIWMKRSTELERKAQTDYYVKEITKLNDSPFERSKYYKRRFVNIFSELIKTGKHTLKEITLSTSKFVGYSIIKSLIEIHGLNKDQKDMMNYLLENFDSLYTSCSLIEKKVESISPFKSKIQVSSPETKEAIMNSYIKAIEKNRDISHMDSVKKTFGMARNIEVLCYYIMLEMSMNYKKGESFDKFYDVLVLYKKFLDNSSKEMKQRNPSDTLNEIKLHSKKIQNFCGDLLKANKKEEFEAKTKVLITELNRENPFDIIEEREQKKVGFVLEILEKIFDNFEFLKKPKGQWDDKNQKTTDFADSFVSQISEIDEENAKKVFYFMKKEQKSDLGDILGCLSPECDTEKKINLKWIGIYNRC